jgi:hypothetical protein
VDLTPKKAKNGCELSVSSLGWRTPAPSIT